MVDFCPVVKWSAIQMVVWKLDWKKSVYGPKCPVFKWSTNSCDFTIWIPDTHTVGYSDESGIQVFYIQMVNVTVRLFNIPHGAKCLIIFLNWNFLWLEDLKWTKTSRLVSETTPTWASDRLCWDPLSLPPAIVEDSFLCDTARCVQIEASPCVSSARRSPCCGRQCWSC